jgi:hypothetical protein
MFLCQPPAILPHLCCAHRAVGAAVTCRSGLCVDACNLFERRTKRSIDCRPTLALPRQETRRRRKKRIRGVANHIMHTMPHYRCLLRSTRAALGDSADSSRGGKLHANNRIFANRRVGRLPHIGLVRAPPTGLFEFAHVVDGGHQGKRQLLYPACLVCSPRWSSSHCDAHIARLSGFCDMSTAAVFRNGLGCRIPATS